MSAPKIVFRSAEVRDWREYKDLRIFSVSHEPSAFTDSLTEVKSITDKEWKHTLRDQDRKVFFAFVNNRVAGMLGVKFFNKEKTRHKATFLSFYISSDYRGLGIGTKLMRFVIQFLKKEKKIVKIDSSVIEDREASLKVHLKNGFKLVGKMHKVLKVGTRYYDQFLLEKVLK